MSYLDIERIQRSGVVDALSLYQAIAEAVNLFRRDDWAGCPPGPGCTFEVEVRPAPTMTYKVDLVQVQNFAKHGTARGPVDILRRNRLRTLLGIEEDPSSR